MIGIFLFTILTLLTVFFFGFGLTLFFIPAKLKAYAFWLTPWFSIFFLVFFLVLSNLLGFSVKQSSPVAIVVMIGFNIWIVWKTKERFRFHVKEDVIIALSKSGTTEEVIKLLPSIKRLGIKIKHLNHQTNIRQTK